MTSENTMGIDFGADVEDMSNDMPATLVFGDASITVMKSITTRNPEIDEAGVLNNIDLEVIGRVADYGENAQPSAENSEDGQDTVTLDGVKYYIETDTFGEDGDIFKYGLRRI